MGCRCQGWGGMRRGMGCVLTGKVRGSLLNPMKAPSMTNGQYTTPHSSISSKIWRKGTATVEPSCQTKKLRKKKGPKVQAGKKQATRMVFCFHWSPPRDL